MGEQQPREVQTQAAALIPGPRTSPENDPRPQPPLKPDYESWTGEVPKPLRPSRIVAGTLAAAALTGVALHGTDQMLASPDQQTLFQEDSPATYTLRHYEFARILKDDTCKTRVSPRQITNVSSVVLGNPRIESTWSPSEHTAAIHAATTSLDQAREQLTFAPLPDEILALEADALAIEHQLPLAEYMKTLVKMLQHYDLEALFYWNSNVYSGVHERVKAIPTKQLETSTQARRVIVATINALAKTPIELVRFSGVQRIVLGNITSADGSKYSGLASSDTRDVYLDVSDEIHVDDTAKWSVLTHELAHQIDFRLCGTNKRAYSDPAYGRDFVYGRDTEAELAQQEAATAAFEAGNPTQKLATPAVMRPYGARTVLEDKGVLMGEHVYFPDSQSQLFKPNTDLSILGYKLSFQLARLAKKNPVLASYYQHSLQLARLMMIKPQR